jgi:hypothetical protein
MTDSPVAAFASHKDPALISGSRGLPRGQTAAINRLRGDRVTALVVEDIDYYAATETFPDLARGVAVPPFQPVAGDFGVPGGKAVHAYLLPPESYCAFIGPMTLVDLDPTAQPRTGKTAALEKGAVLESVDSSLAGEGVGFGVPLVRYPDGDYFAGHAELVDLSTPGAPAWRKTFVLDLAGADDDRSFVAAPARGRIEVDYQVKAGGAIAISVRPLDLQPGYTEVVLMNEQGARFDDYADAAQTRIGAAVGSWTPVAGSWGRFRSGADGVEWEVPALPGATLHAAREAKSPAIDFSGLEYVFDGAFAGADYTVTVQKAR